MRKLLVAVAVMLAVAMPGLAQVWQAEFQQGDSAWNSYIADGTWAVVDGAYRVSGAEEYSGRLAPLAPVADVLIEAQARAGDSARRNFGVILRAQPDRSFVNVRYYDAKDTLEIIWYDKGEVKRIIGLDQALGVAPGAWHTFKAAALGDTIYAKLWPAQAPEPAWQLSMLCEDVRPGAVGLIEHDGSTAEFRAIRVTYGEALNDVRDGLREAKAALAARMAKGLTLAGDPTPLVLRTPDGPMRRVNVQCMLDAKPQPVAGTLTIQYDGAERSIALKAEDFADGAYPLLVKEPANPCELALRLAIDGAPEAIEAQCTVAPARPWVFYMTPHTHFDIGYTHPQPAVIDRLTNDMDLAIAYCEATKDWPEGAQYRWTIEVSALLQYYIERRTPEQVAKLIDLVRARRIELCGFYLNMPSELLGHEEIIRCLYHAQQFRDQYDVPVDTAMINDVPGYGWALPQLFNEAGIRRVAFRANSIRGQFLWYRPGAVPRPFMWEGPEGSKLFVWYTDSYREGNFFREPGLHEADFLRIIQQNEAAGAFVDDIQLRMGGDNLPPDDDASKNARAWNETYVWPRVVVATNREYLDVLEAKYATRCQTFRGDIPSWWAEGPASSALETGANRLLHDRLVGVEAQATLAWLAGGWAYPHDQINKAYEEMILFDEHTWGASGSISAPESEETRQQWAWKAEREHEAERLTSEIERATLAQLLPPTSAAKNTLLLWNPLAWPRTDVARIPLAGTAFEHSAGLALRDPRTGEESPIQIAGEGANKAGFALIREAPALAWARYAVEQRDALPGAADSGESRVLENGDYRIEFSESGAWNRWHDKAAQRELLDPEAGFAANAAMHETPIGGRDAIEKKAPIQFERTFAEKGRFVARTKGAVFDEAVVECALPGCPRIEQRLRLYHGLKAIDIINTVQKSLVYDPEAIYFLFPFQVANPDIQVQIADALMQPGKDQLPYTCYDFYSIQHWARVRSQGAGVLFAPLDAPLVVFSDFNVYKWADRIEFTRGHIYSLVMNNCWMTNFKAGQDGTLTFRYRLTSFTGDGDPVESTRFAWQPFSPLQPAWLDAVTAGSSRSGESGRFDDSRPLISIEGDPIIVSGVKKAERDSAVIVRLLELRGQPARCRVVAGFPAPAKVTGGYRANALEVAQGDLALREGAIDVELRANEIATIGFRVELP